MQSTPNNAERFDVVFNNTMDKIQAAQKQHGGNISASVMACLDISIDAIAALRQLVAEESFSSMEDEINFFKDVKPSFTAELMYWQKRYHIEMDKPPFRGTHMIKYFERRLKDLDHFFKQHIDFYRYVRSGSTEMDHLYYTRLGNKSPMGDVLMYAAHDPSFSTSRDLVLAEMMCNDRIRAFLDEAIAEINSPKREPSDEPVFKISTDLSVAHLACLLRLLHEEKIWMHQNQTALLDFFATHFSTRRQEDISAASLRAKYYNIERSTSEVVKDLLINMLNRLKKL